MQVLWGITGMVGGMTTVAGSTLAGYALLGIPLEYLIAASFMAAPSSLLMAKIMYPETDISETSDDIILAWIMQLVLNQCVAFQDTLYDPLYNKGASTRVDHIHKFRGIVVNHR